MAGMSKLICSSTVTSDEVEKQQAEEAALKQAAAQGEPEPATEWDMSAAPAGGAGLAADAVVRSASSP